MAKFLLLSLSLFVAFLSVAEGEFEFEFESDDYDNTWYFRVLPGNREVEIYHGAENAAISPEPVGHVEIPSLLGGREVTRISEYAFYNCTGLVSVTIPATVKVIEQNAFWGCRSLKDVVIPDGVVSIGADTFYDCTSLATVSLSKSKATIDVYSFRGCRSLTNFVVASENSVYSSVNGLLLSKDASVLIHGVNNNVSIPNTVTSISERAFGDCDAMTDIAIPNSVTNIGASAFYGCTGLTSVYIPDGVTSIGNWVFAGCSNLKSVSIAQSVTNIGRIAFASCDKLSEFVVRGKPDADGVVDVSIPSGLDQEIASKAVVEVAADAKIVKTHGVKMRIMSGGNDIAQYLDIPQTVDGVYDLEAAVVKNDIAKEILDERSGAEIMLNLSSPYIKTSPTKKGLHYTLCAADSLENVRNPDSAVCYKDGDGTSWKAQIPVIGDSSSFYTIFVDWK